MHGSKRKLSLHDAHFADDGLLGLYDVSESGALTDRTIRGVAVGNGFARIHRAYTPRALAASPTSSECNTALALCHARNALRSPMPMH